MRLEIENLEIKLQWQNFSHKTKRFTRQKLLCIQNLVYLTHDIHVSKTFVSNHSRCKYLDSVETCIILNKIKAFVS